MDRKKFDLIVIGSGPGGEAASIMGAKKGLKVLLIDAYQQAGGGSVHWGTIPSKAIRESILIFNTANKFPYIGEKYPKKLLKFEDALKASSNVIQSQVKMRELFYERNEVSICHGVAKFVDSHTVQVTKNDSNEVIKYEANNFVIATGSKPFRPPEIDFTHERILDSDKVLNLKETPKSIAIYGAGIIGAEYACMFRNLGTKVNLINTRSRVLDFLDTEITDAFNHYMREEGITIRNEETFKSISEEEDKFYIHLKSGKQIKCQYLIWAQGREGNSSGLNLDAIGISTNDRGHIKVNEDYATEQPHIYAVGDIIGWPSLAATAYDQGKIATSNILGQAGKKTLSLFPVGIYTSPEISCIGKNEQELTEEKTPYEVGKVNYKNLARAQILGETRGMLKILFHRDSLEVLGVHCFGRNSTEIIHIAQVVMAQPKGHNTIEYFLDHTMNYPTMSEAYRIAAMNGYNRL